MSTMTPDNNDNDASLESGMCHLKIKFSQTEWQQSHYDNHPLAKITKCSTDQVLGAKN